MLVENDGLVGQIPKAIPPLFQSEALVGDASNQDLWIAAFISESRQDLASNKINVWLAILSKIPDEEY